MNPSLGLGNGILPLTPLREEGEDTYPQAISGPRLLQWRRRESNPRPQALLPEAFYMLSRVSNNGDFPTGEDQAPL